MRCSARRRTAATGSSGCGGGRGCYGPFADVRWSSEHALADTLANLEGRSVAFVATLGDVDDARDFGEHAAHFARRVPPPI